MENIVYIKNYFDFVDVCDVNKECYNKLSSIKVMINDNIKNLEYISSKQNEDINLLYKRLEKTNLLYNNFKKKLIE